MQKYKWMWIFRDSNPLVRNRINRYGKVNDLIEKGIRLIVLVKNIITKLGVLEWRIEIGLNNFYNIIGFFSDTTSWK